MAERITGAQALIRALGTRAGRPDVRLPRRVHPAGVRPADGQPDPSRAGASRAGRRPHGRGLCARHRPRRCRHGHLRPGGDEPRHAADGRLHGLDPDGRHHRPGADRRDRHRRLPGVRHDRDHPVVHEAQRTRDDRRGHPDGRPPGVPHRPDRPPRPDADRRPEGLPHQRHDVALAERRRRARLAARLPPERQGPPADDQGSGAADPRLRASGHLRRRWHPQGARRRGAARTRRTDRQLTSSPR